MSNSRSLPGLFIPLNSPGVSLAEVGGKALNLSRLAGAGFPVPNAFFVPTAVYREFLNYNNLSAQIKKILSGIDAFSPKDLDRASLKIRTQFMEGTIHSSLSSALENAWQWLGADPVAVRSSATAEDLPEMSFAGQQDTFLNVIGGKALLEAVVKCWSSLWTARAIGYRARNEISHKEVSLSVVVQNMVKSEASGVLFTANPLTGKRTETAIDAAFGLGEALVSGYLEPDHYVIDSLKDKITYKFIGSKSVMIMGKSEGGVFTKKADSFQKQAIPDNVILKLAKMGKEIEKFYKFPQDIEWAWVSSSHHLSGFPNKGMNMDEDYIYILQSRPITALFPLPEKLPFKPLKFLIGLHVVQGFLEPFTPLGQDIIMLVLIGGGRVFGMDYTLESQTAFYIAAERVWINTTPIIRTGLGHKFYSKVIKAIDPGVALAVARIIRDPQLSPVKLQIRLSTVRRIAGFALPFIRRIIRILLNPERGRDQILKSFNEQVDRVRARQHSKKDMWADFALRVKHLYRAKDIFSRFVIPYGIPPVVAGMASFFGILERFARKAAEATGNSRYKTIYLEIARGLLHNVTTEMDLVLWETAKSLQEDPASLRYFKESSASVLAAKFSEGTLPLKSQNALALFIEKYGMRGIGEIDIGRIRWQEDPAQIIKVLQSYIRIDDPEMAPDVVFKRGVKAAEIAGKELEQAVRKFKGGFLKSRLVRFAISRYRALGGLREAPKFFAIRIMGIIREGLLDSGQDLAAAGLIEKRDDLFYLRLKELDKLRQLVEKGISKTSDEWKRAWMIIRQKIARRREVYKLELRRKQIPRVIMSDGTAYFGGVNSNKSDSPVNSSVSIIGDPVSPGAVNGLVRVVLQPQDAKLKPGEILVCKGTDPAWTPLFLIAGGLVMEIGGIMTHGSIVAREYGIPAVVGVDQATTRLKTGDRVNVNGSTGVVEVINDQ
ncbi:MAG: hypothetical protein GXP33_09550 [Spirochaetes bacterium]|nr:hypothetical protein [Spirochaetota bacterium]